MKTVLERIKSIKFPLLMLALGVVLMLLPSSPKAETSPAGSGLDEILSLAEGVGDTRVLISDEGVIVVCEGADDPTVRWEVTEAVHAYTGFGAAQITILKKVK